MAMDGFTMEKAHICEWFICGCFTYPHEGEMDKENNVEILRRERKWDPFGRGVHIVTSQAEMASLSH